MTDLSPASTANERLPPELVERFRGALAQLDPGSGRIGLAVSGGPDSMALLLLAQATMPGGFDIATVDHGLRPEAADECALVAAACAARGIVCTVLRVAVEPGNVQQQARIARYAELGRWAEEHSLAAIATAHHADDQAETLLMRLNRGSGVAGLAGVRRVGRVPQVPVPVIRPLLAFRRAELAQVIAAAGVEVVHDPGNYDPRYDRVRYRRALAGCDWLDPAALAQSASHLAEAYDALQAYAELLWPQAVRLQGSGFVLTPGPSREMNRRLLAQIMERLGGRPRGGDVARLLTRLEAREGGNVGGVLATAKGGEWYLRPEPRRRA